MSTQPNVLLISTDHWPAALLGVAGHPVIQTPTLDELARSGVRFTNAYSECPVCIPARRTLMTGVTPRIHGDHVFRATLPMPNLPTMAQAFRGAGYQTYAVGKLHVYPQRDRIGFDDVILDEEGRLQYGVVDDYELFLGDQGYAGCQFDHGMSNNQYSSRAWHLSEETHATNWATQQMSRIIKRRDPTRPAFWYLSYRHPHPPLGPLQTYLDFYQHISIDTPYLGDWITDSEDVAYSMQANYSRGAKINIDQSLAARRAFYALCTHIDHQLRIVIGTLREEGLLNGTIICFTSDHGDMLGNHNMWAKRLFYEYSANIPMILVDGTNGKQIGYDCVDDRLVGWQDVMPTLLDMANIDIPETVEGFSMAGHQKRDWFYAEVGEDDHATRMIHDGRYKLIYYPVGNYSQLFDIQNDPNELDNLVGNPNYTNTLKKLTNLLISQLYGGDETWVQDGQLVGLPDKEFISGPNKGLSSQRGHHWPPPPQTNMPQIEWFSENKE